MEEFLELALVLARFAPCFGLQVITVALALHVNA
jgi:hypothetical protein